MRDRSSRNGQDVDPGTSLASRIAAEIATDGPISFARFMHRALYEPELGFYTGGRRRVGHGADFVTSPSVGAAFGRTLAKLVPLVATVVGESRAVRVVDAGAGDGQLATALVPELDRLLPGADLEVVLVERSRARLAATSRLLRAAGARVDELADCSELAALAPRSGVVIANELFDALPLRRLRRRRGRIEEAFVVVNAAGGFADSWRDAADPEAWLRLPPDRECAVAQGTAELVGQLASAIDRGLLLIIDYGYPGGILYAEDGPGNPVRGYAGGRSIDAILDSVGEVDLTAHVDFSAIDRAAAAIGLERVFFTEQTYLLLALGFLEDRDAATARRLIHPEDLGGTFKCLLLAKGFAAERLQALPVRDRSRLLSG